MNMQTSIITGDWLFTGDGKYTVGYEGVVTDSWSGGVNWQCTREVAERVVADQDKLIAERMPQADRLVWVGPVLIWVSQDMDPPAKQLGPDEDGLYDMPSWTWYECAADQCAEVVTGEAPTEEDLSEETVQALRTKAAELTAHADKIDELRRRRRIQMCDGELLVQATRIETLLVSCGADCGIEREFERGEATREELEELWAQHGMRRTS